MDNQPRLQHSKIGSDTLRLDQVRSRRARPNGTHARRGLGLLRMCWRRAAELHQFYDGECPPLGRMAADCFRKLAHGLTEYGSCVPPLSARPPLSDAKQQLYTVWGIVRVSAFSCLASVLRRQSRPRCDHLTIIP